MYIRNRYQCYNCHLGYSETTDEVVKKSQCPNCGYPSIWETSLEFDDNDLLLKEYFRDGTVLEHKNPHKLETVVKVKSKPTVTCPYCNSTDCKKLGAISRGVSFGLFGFGSGKIGKQWHCNSCKSDF